ncbi:MAG: pirin-like C-terminal cupin domain-containing protein [Bacteroidales bacterium]|nr:pirin-like C-terminal cupin domain-containing protein [Bacteroidales bacterium]
MIAAEPLHEPVAWGGPIVMNTQEELNRAFEELDEGTFIRHVRS